MIRVSNTKSDKHREDACCFDVQAVLFVHGMHHESEDTEHKVASIHTEYYALYTDCS